MKGWGWGVVKEMSLRSHLDNKAAVLFFYMLLLLVWVWDLGRNYVLHTGCIWPGVLGREDRIAKSMRIEEQGLVNHSARVQTQFCQYNDECLWARHLMA